MTSTNDIDWPSARVQDRRQLGAQGASSIVGAVILAYTIYHRNWLGAVGAACVLLFGLLRLKSPNLETVAVRDARVSVRGGVLRVDGHEHDVAQVWRRSTPDGQTVVVVESRRGAGVHIHPSSPDARRALLGALGTAQPPYLFFHGPKVLVHVATGLLLAVVLGAYAAATQGWPGGWRWLWLLSLVPFIYLVRFRLVVGAKELVIGGPSEERIPIRDVRGAIAEPARAGGPPVWLDLETASVMGRKLWIVSGGGAGQAAKVIQRYLRRARE